MTRFQWGNDVLAAEFALTEDGVLRWERLGAPGASHPEYHPGAPAPLVAVTATGHGRNWSGNRWIHSAIGERLRYKEHRETHEDGLRTLTVRLQDPDTGLVAEAVHRLADGIPVLRAEVVLRNEGRAPLHLEAVASLVVGCLTDALDDADLLWADNDWLAEFRWQRRPLRDTSPALDGRVRTGNGRGAFVLAGQGAWSSGGKLPMGGLTDRRTGRTWLWQVEHNGGGWRWECGEREHSAYAAVFGPSESLHAWRHTLEPGAEFRTVPVALAFGEDPDAAFAALTAHRRATRRPHPDHEHLPVIFNDYMNCLMGDPTTAKLLPLVEAAAEAGAEYFVIDAGWYADEAENWWNTVGAWEPSRTRFPGARGIHEVLDHVRDLGMVPGLWLEPEVVGTGSAVAGALPEEAFFRRDGVRVVEAGRYHLDLRHPAARAHLDRVVDRLVGDWGVGYLKLDHNVDPGPGTSAHPGESPGAGMLGHHRAHLEWLDGVLDRYPRLVVENCASGGMRVDHALLSRLQIQSTSDQENLVHYAPIAAAAPTAVTPEQGAVWAYPRGEDTLDEVAYTMASALLGRVHLSGGITELQPEARALVREAVAVYKAIRADLPGALPSWPLGLPAWDDPWVALALRTPSTTYVTAWRRGGESTAALHLPHLLGVEARVNVLYPSTSQAAVEWHADRAELSFTLPVAPAAALVRLEL